MTNRYHYPGKELQLFQRAGKWKRYMAGKIRPYIVGDVLEVGAGIGETTEYLLTGKINQWTFLEPDRSLFEELQAKLEQERRTVPYKSVCGTLSELPDELLFDTILYIDVLEHIENDHAELSRAFCHVRKGGRLIVLSPAHQGLYSPFDKAIGHYRRYTKWSLRKAANLPGVVEEKIFYIDSAAILLLWLNKHLIRKQYPTEKDIWIWQTIFIPISKLLDKILFYTVGKSIVGVWRKS